MAVTILFLGPLSDLAGGASRDVAAPLDWAGLLDNVGEDLADVLKGERIHVAISGKVLIDKTALYAADGDEVALLPPVSGG